MYFSWKGAVIIYPYHDIYVYTNQTLRSNITHTCSIASNPFPFLRVQNFHFRPPQQQFAIVFGGVARNELSPGQNLRWPSQSPLWPSGPHLADVRGG